MLILLVALQILQHALRCSADGTNKFLDTYAQDLKPRTGLLDLLNEFRLVKHIKIEEFNFDPAPDEFDYRKKGVVTPVKDQGNCHSDWAFSFTGNVEGQYASQNQKLVSLSEQMLIDCTNQGCNQLDFKTALRELHRRQDGRMMTEQDYPYTGQNSSTCNFDKSKTIVKVNSYWSYSFGNSNSANELMIKNILVSPDVNGPMSVEVAAEPLKKYKGGIMTGAACDASGSVDTQQVLLVGYGKENGITYWILKNSYGTKWGEDGYFRIQAGVNCLNIFKPDALLVSVNI